MVVQDWERLRTYLAARGMELDRARQPLQFRGGLANLNYLLSIGGRPVVLRRPPPGPLPPKAYDMEREFRVLSALAPLFPLVPAPLHCCTDAAVLGAPFILMEYRPGITISVRLPEHADRPEIAASLASLMVELLADLHALPADRGALAAIGRPEGFLARMTEGWIRRVEAVADPRSAPIRREIGTWLRRRIPAERDITFLHNDFKLDNILLDRERLTPVAVIDWDMATRGDPLFDLAVLTSYWTEPGDPPEIRELRQMPTTRPGFPSRREVVEAYARRTGRDLSDFPFYRVLSLLRLAGIFLQLHDRFRRGNVDDPRYAAFGPLGEHILAFAWQSARSGIL